MTALQRDKQQAVNDEIPLPYHQGMDAWNEQCTC